MTRSPDGSAESPSLSPDTKSSADAQSSPEPGRAGSVLCCPECSSVKVYRSHRRNTIEILRSKIGSHPFRCRDCSHRFIANSAQFRSQEKADRRIETRKRKLRRAVRAGVISTVCVAAFLIFLYYLVQPPQIGNAQ